MSRTNSYAISLSLLLGACGATADPSPHADAGAILAHGCRWGEARIGGGTCVPTDDDNCGARGRACRANETCAIDRVADGSITIACVADED